MTEVRSAQIPEGFSLVPTRGPFTDINGPIWRKAGLQGAPAKFGFLPEKRHTNTLGFVHGGMISTLMDSSMAQAAFERHRCRLVTLTLGLSFHHAVFRGRWAEIEILSIETVETEISVNAHLLSRGLKSVEAEAKYRLFPNKD